MKIAVIGAGNVGRALTGSLRKAGHTVVVTAAHPDRAAEVAREIGANAEDSVVEAVRDSEMVILAVPFAKAGKAVADEIRPVSEGKVVVDATNPIGPEMQLMTDGTSAAEEFQRWLPGAKVIKAFNTLFASRQADPTDAELELDGFVAGDDAAAKQAVMDVVRSMGLRPVDAGELEVARILEGMALLNIKLQVANGWAWRSAWKLIG